MYLYNMYLTNVFFICKVGAGDHLLYFDKNALDCGKLFVCVVCSCAPLHMTSVRKGGERRGEKQLCI